MPADKQFGRGMRVWIGWAPGHQVHGLADARLRLGTIVDGPHPPGLYLFDGIGLVVTQYTAWDVETDDGVTAGVAEQYLHPVDDGEEDNDVHAQHRGAGAQPV